MNIYFFQILIQVIQKLIYFQDYSSSSSSASQRSPQDLGNFYEIEESFTNENSSYDCETEFSPKFKSLLTISDEDDKRTRSRKDLDISETDSGNNASGSVGNKRIENKKDKCN